MKSKFLNFNPNIPFTKVERILLAAFVSIILLLLSLFLVIRLSHHYIPNKTIDIPKFTASIPQEDKEILEWFFRELLVHERFAYTLFSDKPLSLGIYLDLSKYTPAQASVQPQPNPLFKYSLLNKGWQTWKKYKPFFPERNFVLKQVNRSKDNVISFLLINKKCFRSAIHDNIKIFRQFLSPNITHEKLLHEFLNKSYPFKEVLNNNSALIGILCGFGKNNSLMYRRKREIEFALLPEFYKKQSGSHFSNLNPSENFETLEEELQYITSVLKPFPKIDNHPLRLPTFQVDPNTNETKQLKKKYLNQRDRILEYLSQDNFLEIVLEQLSN